MIRLVMKNFILNFVLTPCLFSDKASAQKVYSTDYQSQADKKIYFVKYESQADLKTYLTDYRSRSGWKKQSKKHLMN